MRISKKKSTTPPDTKTQNHFVENVKSRIELNKQLHYTTLVPWTVLLLVRFTLSYMQIKFLFTYSVNAHFASNYPTLRASYLNGV